VFPHALLANMLILLIENVLIVTLIVLPVTLTLLLVRLALIHLNCKSIPVFLIALMDFLIMDFLSVFLVLILVLLAKAQVPIVLSAKELCSFIKMSVLLLVLPNTIKSKYY
jgi:hypothetical protein